MRKQLHLAFAVCALLFTQSCKKNDSNLSAAKSPGSESIKRLNYWAPPQPLINGKYKFVQYQTPSRAVCVVNNGFFSDLIHHWTYTQSNEAQNWNATKQTIGGVDYYKLVNALTGKALAAPNATPGAQLVQATVATDDKQLWQITHIIWGVHSVVNKSTGLAATLSTVPGVDGTTITQTAYTSPGVGGQHFFFYNMTENFYNPLLSGGADPWVIKRNGFYYYMQTGGITIRKTAKMSELYKATSTTVDLNALTSPTVPADAKSQIWAPELHFLDNKWYIYYAASDGTDANHRMHVLENASADPTTGTWTYKGKITDASNIWAIDGTVLEHNGSKYFLWSGWAIQNTSQSGIQQLYIALMSNPWTISGSRVKISEPTYAWEKNGLVNEGPEILKNSAGTVFCIYSGSGCWTDDYKLGQLTLTGANPLLMASWTKKSTAVFEKNTTNSVYGPGHNSFFKSGTEDWIVYHANPQTGQGCGGNRSPRMQKFTWNGSNEPNFGVPVSTADPIQRPSGE